MIVVGLVHGSGEILLGATTYKVHFVFNFNLAQCVLISSPCNWRESVVYILRCAADRFKIDVYNKQESSTRA
jgi:hypothetical protein